nr:DUF4166 domain-containing protein [uncultured Microbacterium sp.]
MTAADAEGSPYERALGERISELHPKTAWYFRTIPDGQVGVGTGEFTTAGSRHWWLWPMFRVAEALGVAFAGWQRDLPFRIENRTIAGRAIAVRYFDLPGRTWVMPDTVEYGPDRILRNEIGPHRTVVTTFDIGVSDGAVTLSIRRVGLRLGRLRIAAPAFLRPQIRLVERWDEEREKHHVAMTIDAPVLGRVYEYIGYFSYVIDEDAAA